MSNATRCNVVHGCCEGCEEQFEAYDTCLVTVTFFDCDIDCDAAPTPSPTLQPTTSAPTTDDITDGGFCDMATEAICGFGTCCEPCAAEFVEFDECFETIVADVTFGVFEIDCDDFEAPEDKGTTMILAIFLPRIVT